MTGVFEVIVNANDYDPVLLIKQMVQLKMQWLHHRVLTSLK